MIFINQPLNRMRITIEIEEKKLTSILKETRQTKKSPAVAAALDEYLGLKSRQRFVAKVMAGKTSYGAGNREIEFAASLDPR